MLQKIVDFIFLLLKSFVWIAIITVIEFFVIVVLSIIMPDNAAKAFELFKGLLSS